MKEGNIKKCMKFFRFKMFPQLIVKACKAIYFLIKKYVFSTYRIVIVKVSTDNVPNVFTEVKLNLKEMSFSDLEALKGLLPHNKLELFGRRIKHGFTGLIAYNESGNPVHVVWLAYGKWKDPTSGIKFKMNEEEAVTFDSITFPEFRRKNVQKYIGVKVLEYLKTKGFNACYGHFVENSISQQTNKSFNSQVARRVFVVCIVGIYLNFDISSLR